MKANLPISDSKFEQFVNETNADPTLQELEEYVASGWPNSRDEVESSVTPYFNYRDKILLQIILQSFLIYICYPTKHHQQSSVTPRVNLQSLEFQRRSYLTKAQSLPQTVKSTLKKALRNNEDPYLAILALRTTPQKNGMPSPATCLMNRNLRTILPLFNVNKKRRKPKNPKPSVQKINMPKNINHLNPVQQ